MVQFLLSLMILFLIPIFLCTVGFFVSMKSPWKFKKIFPFECGFELMNSVYMFFSIQFYIIGLIFILFDLELILLIPAMKINNYSLSSGVMVLVFFSSLSLGYVYEYQKNFLSWK